MSPRYGDLLRGQLLCDSPLSLRGGVGTGSVSTRSLGGLPRQGVSRLGGEPPAQRGPCPPLCAHDTKCPENCKVTSGKLLGTNSSFLRGLAGKIPRSLRNDKPRNCCFITNKMLFPSPALSHRLSLKHPKVVFFFFFF